MGRSSVIQRVTYKGVLYDPASAEAQATFLAEAKRDMEAAGTWLPWRSENIIKQIGRTPKIIVDVMALGIEEGWWKDYDKELNADLQDLGNIHRTIHARAQRITDLIARSKVEDVSAQLNEAADQITAAVNSIPEKWNLKQKYPDTELKDRIGKLMGFKPWQLSERMNKIKAELAVPPPDPAQAAGPPPPSPPVAVQAGASVKQLERTLQTLEKQARSADRAAANVVGTLERLAVAAQKNESDLRASAGEQYRRAQAGYVSAGSPMNKKKFYLGKIATTRAIAQGPQGATKGKGVLFARPWSPGVNKAFLEGGVDAGAVYKLRTVIPDNLKQHLVGGNHAAFKAAVRDQAGEPYRPFWYAPDGGRFTIYTEELAYLAEKGYRLHEFRRKNGKPAQQIMVHPDQLAEVTAAYAGR